MSASRAAPAAPRSEPSRQRRSLLRRAACGLVAALGLPVGQAMAAKGTAGAGTAALGDASTLTDCPPGLQAVLAASRLPLSQLGLYITPVPQAGRRTAAHSPAPSTAPTAASATAQAPSAAPLAQWQADRSFTMGSTAKLVTSLAALDLLGPRHRWRTAAHLDGEQVAGHLRGDLVLVGGGDAALSADDLRQWFAAMRAQGLHQIDGDIVIDRRAFRLSTADAPLTPAPALDRPHHVAPDAFTVDAGVLTVTLARSAQGHWQAQAQPALAGLELQASAQAVRAGCAVQPTWSQGPDADLRLQIDARLAPGCTPKALRLSPLPHTVFSQRAVSQLWADAGGRLLGQVTDGHAGAATRTGRARPRVSWVQAPRAEGRTAPAARALQPFMEWWPLPAPTQTAAWSESGSAASGAASSVPAQTQPAAAADGQFPLRASAPVVEVTHRPIRANGSTPAVRSRAAVTPWSTWVSEPLAQRLRQINKHSDNLAARQLLLSMAPQFPRRPASLTEARQRVAGWLQRQGLAPDDLRIDNGSGLSVQEQARPRALAQLLAKAWGTPAGQELLDSLPIAGVDGTLQQRMTDGPAKGRAFLKTGTLNETRALAGYVRSASGTVHVLVAIVNGPEAPRAAPVLDQIVEWVVAHA